MLTNITHKHLIIQKSNFVLFYLFDMLANLKYNKIKIINAHDVRRQENNVVWWVVVIVAVVSIVALMAACKLFGGSFAGEFSLIGILKVNIKCKL